jgi:ParB family chromosome partitioning protein
VARRRRLEAPSGADLAAIRAEAAHADTTGRVANPLAAPPIARVAADSGAAQAREIAALREEAGQNRAAAARLAQAEAGGLMVTEVPIDEIDVDYLARDRMPKVDEDDDWRALKASIRAHGQRTPVDLTRLAPGAGKPYGLIAGHRRMAALDQIAFETGDARWRRVRALIHPTTTLAQAFIGMVEENEIRAGLSFYERARVCVLAAGQGAFSAPDAALETLFASASPARRSKIRSFIRLVEEAGDLLRWPDELGERLGLRLAAAVKAGRGGALRRFLAGRVAGFIDAADEQAALARFLTAAGPHGRGPRRPADRSFMVAARNLADGGVLEHWLTPEHVAFRVRMSVISGDQAERILAALTAILDEG